jgi:hypothetical protein
MGNFGREDGGETIPLECSDRERFGFRAERRKSAAADAERAQLSSGHIRCIQCLTPRLCSPQPPIFGTLLEGRSLNWWVLPVPLSYAAGCNTQINAHPHILLAQDACQSFL